MTAHARPEPPPSHLVHAAKQRLLAALRADAQEPDTGGPTLPVSDAPATSDHTTAWPGDLAAPAAAPDDRYEFGEPFAAGGLGLVRKAHDRRLGRTIAVKELLRDDPEAERRFALEAAITARLQHPSIIPLYDVGRHPGGPPYYCMKLVDGQSLEHHVRRCETAGERVALLDHVIAAADAVAHAHRNGVIHRDLKPANILVGEQGETVVIDWGLAKDLNSSKGDASPGPRVPSGDNSLLTAHGTVLGTLRYMPPEQARGEAVDARGDVFSLGAVLYHVLAGVAPFEGLDSRAVVAALCAGQVDRLVRAIDVPAELVAIVERAMAPRREDRYPTAEAFAEDLRRFRTGRLVDAHRYSAGEVMRRWLRRHRAVTAVAGAALVAVAGVGAVAVQNIRGERDRAGAAEQQAVQAQHAAEGALLTARAQTREARLAQARGALETDVAAAMVALADVDVSDETAARRARMIAVAAESRGAPSRVLRGHTRPIADVVGLASGELVSVDIAGAVFRWDPKTGRGAQVLDAKEQRVTLIAARDAATFAVVGEKTAHVVRDDGSIEVIDVSGLPRGFYRVPLYRWELSAGGETLAALGEPMDTGFGAPALLWDLRARPAVASVVPGVRGGKAALRPDGRAVAFEEAGRVVSLWDGETTTRLTGLARALGYSSGGGHLYGFPGGEPRVAAVTPGAPEVHELGRWILGLAGDDRVLAIAFEGLMSTAHLSLRSLATGEARWDRTFDSESLAQWGHYNDYEATVDPIGDGLAIRVRDHWLLGSLATGALPRRLETGMHVEAAWFPGGFALARVDALWIWDTPREAQAPTAARSYAALSRDGARAVGYTTTGGLALVDLASGAELASPCLVGLTTEGLYQTGFELDAQGRMIVATAAGVCLQDSAGAAHRPEVSGKPISGAMVDRGEGFAVGFDDGTLLRWRAVGAAPERVSFADGVFGVTLLPDDAGAIVRARDGEVAAVTGARTVRLDGGQGGTMTAFRSAVAVHPQAPIAAVALAGEDALIVRDFASGAQQRRTVAMPDTPVLAYSPAGRLAVAVGGHGLLVLDEADAGGGRELGLPEEAVAFGWLDEYELAVVGDHGSLVRADTVTGEAVVVRRGFLSAPDELPTMRLAAAPSGAVTLFSRAGFEIVQQPADLPPREPARLSAWLRDRAAALGRKN